MSLGALETTERTQVEASEAPAKKTAAKATATTTTAKKQATKAPVEPFVTRMLPCFRDYMQVKTVGGEEGLERVEGASAVTGRHRPAAEVLRLRRDLVSDVESLLTDSEALSHLAGAEVNGFRERFEDSGWYVENLRDAPVERATVFGLFDGWARCNDKAALGVTEQGGWIYLGRAAVDDWDMTATEALRVLGLGSLQLPRGWPRPAWQSFQQSLTMNVIGGLFDHGLREEASARRKLPTFGGWVMSVGGWLPSADWRVFVGEHAVTLLPSDHATAPILLTPDVVRKHRTFPAMGQLGLGVSVRTSPRRLGGHRELSLRGAGINAIVAWLERSRG